MLSNDEEEQVRDAISAIANRGASAISKAASAWEAIGFIRSLHSSIDKAIATEVETTLNQHASQVVRFVEAPRLN